jgi:hypothetical protein
MDTPQIPTELQSAGLGAPKAYFPVKAIHRMGSLVMFFLLLGASVLVFLYGVYGAYQAYHLHGPALIDDKLATPAIAALVLFLLGLLAGWSAYANWHKAVVVYERGFACYSRKELQAWNWDEITSLTAAVTRHYTNGIYTGTTHIYTLLNKRNERLVISDTYKNVEKLAQAIEQAIFPRLYDQAAAQYNTGQTLAFGPVTISKDGIQIGKKTYPWTEVKAVSIHQGILKVSQKDGGWFSGASATASTIPNLGVLLNIIHQVTGLKTG